MPEKQEVQKLTYSIPEIAKLLGIGKAKAYELSRRADFPKIPSMGKRVVVPKEEFHKWISKIVNEGIQEG